MPVAEWERVFCLAGMEYDIITHNAAGCAAGNLSLLLEMNVDDLFQLEELARRRHDHECKWPIVICHIFAYSRSSAVSTQKTCSFTTR